MWSNGSATRRSRILPTSAREIRGATGEQGGKCERLQGGGGQRPISGIGEGDQQPSTGCKAHPAVPSERRQALRARTQETR